MVFGKRVDFSCPGELLIIEIILGIALLANASHREGERAAIVTARAVELNVLLYLFPKQCPGGKRLYCFGWYCLFKLQEFSIIIQALLAPLRK